MSRPSRNLMLMAALCWVAPASAQHITMDAPPHAKGCPNAGTAQAVVISSDETASGIPVSPSRRTFFP
ncbi:MAG: hypothetical protein HOP96_06115 [Sphingomonas sp.]|nr:hypothetical protein [Sphingomonas sp.]